MCSSLSQKFAQKRFLKTGMALCSKAAGSTSEVCVNKMSTVQSSEIDGIHWTQISVMPTDLCACLLSRLVHASPHNPHRSSLPPACFACFWCHRSATWSVNIHLKLHSLIKQSHGWIIKIIKIGGKIIGWPFMLFNMMKTVTLLDSVRSIISGGSIQTIARKILFWAQAGH